MASVAATFPQVTPFGGRGFSFGDLRRVIVRHAVLGLAAVAAVCATGAIVTVAAAWIVAGTLSETSNFHARATAGLETIALARPYRSSFDTAYVAGPARFAANPAAALESRAEEPPRAVAALSAPIIAPPVRANRIAEHTDSVTARRPAALDGPHSSAKHDIARAPAGHPAPLVVAVASLPPAPAAQKPLTAPLAHSNPIALPDRESRTAVYDIEAHTVYLPNGEKLEAHSGIGRRMDDAHFAGEKNRGPTPPNVYDLTVREDLFHGVRAIRLNPVDDGKMHGRDGMLAHTYMLGPTGQSFGCVSFKDYPAFLRAFQKGEVARLVVVPRLGNTVTPATISRRRHSGRYASNDD
jgi:hypothetical protein